jgi:hypothetical protein
LEIIVYNDISKEILIDFIFTCDCFWSDTDKLILSPDESGTVTFSFDPKDENGVVFFI